MDQSGSSSAATAKRTEPIVAPPPRTFTVEFLVGLFAIIGLAAVGYLAVGLGDVSLIDSGRYRVYAEFDNVSGLKYGASVELAGVPVGAVERIALKDPMAVVTLSLNRDFKLRDDDIASIRTKGIIGDRYVKISRGASDVYIEAEGRVTETESVVDIEDIIGKVVHSLGGDKDEDTKPDGAAGADGGAKQEARLGTGSVTNGTAG